MKNRSLFVFSVVVIILALCQFSMAMSVYNSTATRDFDFGPPILIVLSVIEGIVGVIGLLYSIIKTKQK